SASSCAPKGSASWSCPPPASTRRRPGCASRARGCGASSWTRTATSWPSSIDRWRSTAEVIDAWGAAALGLVCLEWLGLGWLSGLSLPGPPLPGTWALRLLVGACVVGAAQLVLALAGVGFASIPLVLMVAAGGAAILRLARRGASGAGYQAKQQPLARGERLGWLLLGLVLLAATLRSLLVPESGWDAYSHWGLRAQA